MTKRKLLNFFILFFLFSSGGWAQDRKNPFLVEWDDSIQSLKPGDTYSLKLSFHVPEGYFIYRDKTEVSLKPLPDLKIIQKTYPPSQTHVDPFIKKPVQVYLHDFEIMILLKLSSQAPLGRQTLEGELRYQGCSDDFCYRPMKVPLLIPLDVVSSLPSQPTLPQSSHQTAGGQASLIAHRSALSPQFPANFWEILKEGKLEHLLSLNPFLFLFLVFLGGVLTDFTPCVLPIIPLTLAVVGVKKNRSLVHNMGVSLSLVLGMACTYAALGLLSAFLGLRLGFLFQSVYFLFFLILFFIFLSLALWGVIHFELPLAMRNFLGKVGGDGFRGAFLAGLTIGFIASPCVGPLIAPLLLWVAQAQNLMWGAGVLFVYALGMGSLFFVTGTFFSTFGSRLRGGRYTEFLKKILALLILLPALYYGYILVHQSLGKQEKAGWVHSLSQGLEQAKTGQKPMVIDFYADWCLPCLELDQKTFADLKVQKTLEDFVKIKIDCTLETPHCNEAVRRFGVIGWPTVLFLDKNQVLQKDLSVVGGFVGPEKMQKILEEIQNRSSHAH